jgi:hypothetical protein
MTLTDTHLVLLSAAAQRQDGLLTPPDRLQGSARQALAAKLLTSGLAQEIAVTRDQPHWHTDEGGCPKGLQITRAGLEAIGIDPDDEQHGSAPAEAASRPIASGSSSSKPQAGSKQALVLELLRRDSGVSLDDLTAATGWLPHTTRAVLTGLRKKGHQIERRKGEDGRSSYRVAEPTEADTLGTVAEEA